MTTNFIYIFLTLVIMFGCSSNTTEKANNETEQLTIMSSNVLKLIPTDPSYVPAKLKQDNAKTFLNKIYKKEQIRYITTDTIEFVDQGANFESVSCNLCGDTIETEEWQNAMDKSYETQFTDLAFMSPCCNKKTSLNDLDYKSPAGFSKFVVEIQRAQEELTEKDFRELEEILGTSLRVIWAHY